MIKTAFKNLSLICGLPLIVAVIYFRKNYKFKYKKKRFAKTNLPPPPRTPLFVITPHLDHSCMSDQAVEQSRFTCQKE